RRQRLHPVLSNLLPEGALQTFIAQQFRTHPDNEFELLQRLGRDLPGALVAEPARSGDVPWALFGVSAAEVAKPSATPQAEHGFSLAGVQMKFSMREQARRFTLAGRDALGGWIVKTPSTVHSDVPLNEYTAMQLAALAGVDVPETRLIALTDID